MRDAERNCGTFEPFIPPYTPPNANRATASKAFRDFDRTFDPFISPYSHPKANRETAPKPFEAFATAEDALKLADQSSVDQGGSVSDASPAFPRPKKRRIETVVSTAAALVVIISIGSMAVVLSPRNKTAATHDVSDAARPDLQTVSLGSGKRSNAENAVGTNDPRPDDPDGVDQSTPSSVRTQPGKSAVQIESRDLVNYWLTVSAAIPTEVEISNPPTQPKAKDTLQLAIRELFIRSANATSYRDLGISTQ